MTTTADGHSVHQPPPPFDGDATDSYPPPCDAALDTTGHGLEHHGGHSNEAYISVLFLFVALTSGAACRSVFLNTKLPYTVALLLFGMILGAVNATCDLGLLSQSIEKWVAINPHLLLHAFLPGLVFESAFSMEWHTFKQCLNQCLLLATVGVVIGALLLAAFAYYVFPYGWSWQFCMMTGALLCATDPVAVVALLKELGASKKLGTVIEGESLLNDGTAMVLFMLFLDLARGEDKSAADIAVFFVRMPLLGPLIGLAMGAAMLTWLGYVYNDALVDISLTLVTCYLAMFVSEEWAHSSGVLAVVTLGAYLGAYGKPYFSVSTEVEETLHHFWGMMTYGANTVIFIVTGVIIVALVQEESGLAHIEAADFAWTLLLFLFAILARGLTVLLLFPALSRIGYGLTWQNAVVCTWGGLRGAVGLALALIVFEEPAFSPRERALVVFHTGGIVVLSLCVNGTTTGWLLHALRLDQGSTNRDKVMASIKHEMSEIAYSTYLSTFVDDTLGYADFDTVSRYVSVFAHVKKGAPEAGRAPARAEHSWALLKRLGAKVKKLGSEGKRVQEQAAKAQHLHEELSHRGSRGAAEEGGAGTSASAMVEDVRARVLDAVKREYWEMSGLGHNRKALTLLLVESIDSALDKVGSELCDWGELQRLVRGARGWSDLLAAAVGWLPLPLPLRDAFKARVVTRRQEVQLAAAVSFLAAHRTAAREVQELLDSDSALVRAVLQESARQCTAAEAHVHEVRLCFPEVAHALKTQEVTRGLLAKQHSYVQGLVKAGVLTDGEAGSILEELQRDKKRFVRTPPRPLQPSLEQVVAQLPLVQALRSDALREFAASSLLRGFKTFTAGEVVLQEGGADDMVYLIGRGVVEVALPARPSEAAAEGRAAAEAQAGPVAEAAGSFTRPGGGRMMSQLTAHRGALAAPQTVIARMGSKSHPIGWMMGAPEVLCRAGEEAPARRGYSVTAASLVHAFALEGALLRKLMQEPGEEAALALLCRTAAGAVVETQFRSQVAAAFPSAYSALLDALVARSHVRPLLKDATLHLDSQEHFVVLLQGAVHSADMGVLHSPALLTLPAAPQLLGAAPEALRHRLASLKFDLEGKPVRGTEPCHDGAGPRPSALELPTSFTYTAVEDGLLVDVALGRTLRRGPAARLSPLLPQHLSPRRSGDRGPYTCPDPVESSGRGAWGRPVTAPGHDDQWTEVLNDTGRVRGSTWGGVESSRSTPSDGVPQAAGEHGSGADGGAEGQRRRVSLDTSRSADANASASVFSSAVSMPKDMRVTFEDPPQQSASTSRAAGASWPETAASASTGATAGGDEVASGAARALSLIAEASALLRELENNARAHLQEAVGEDSPPEMIIEMQSM